ncbi:MAG: amidohydrolase family protein, partial [Deltaproteobacteria bacterium]|nr:amidohydrolase family protein [Deltaproteobacteria bacterium]
YRQQNPPFSGVKIILDQTTGLLNPTQKDLNELVFNIHKSGLQAVIHAIEEPSIEAAIYAIAHALKKHPRSDHRHRIDHCSVCPPALSKRMASLGIMVVTQPSFIYYNGDRYLQTVPNYQLKSLYPIGSLMRSGVHVAGSSDCPIAPPNPLIGIYAAVNRRTKTGNKVLSEESITPLVSLKLYTTYAARATLQERNLGSITPGKMADLIVLNGDPTTLPPDDLKNIQVEMTVINGRILWDKSVLTHNSSFDV